MPQIDQLSENWYFASQLFWLVLVFGAIFFGIGLFMLPKVEATVDLRDRKIADDLAAAKAARDAADAAEEDYRNRANAARGDAQAVIASAKADATSAAAAQLAKANKAIETKMAKAEAAIAAARTAALSEVENVAADVTTDLVSRVSGLTISAADAARAAKAALAHG